MDSLTDKVCVVTGGGSGIGRELARRFLAAGMRVVIGDIEPGAIDATLTELGGDGNRIAGVQCDVRSVESVRRLRDQTIGPSVACMSSASMRGSHPSARCSRRPSRCGTGCSTSTSAASSTASTCSAQC